MLGLAWGKVTFDVHMLKWSLKVTSATSSPAQQKCSLGEVSKVQWLIPWNISSQESQVNAGFNQELLNQEPAGSDASLSRWLWFPRRVYFSPLTRTFQRSRLWPSLTCTISATLQLFICVWKSKLIQICNPRIWFQMARDLWFAPMGWFWRMLMWSRTCPLNPR